MRRRKNQAASVKQRLLNLARQRGEQFHLVLSRFGIERLLYRLSRTEHGTDFVLNGAVLFHLWTEVPHRPTRDVDLLGRGTPEPARLAEIFRAVCKTDVEDDGLAFLPESVRAEPIREGAAYLGIRVRLESRLGSARVRLQVDVSFGDAIVPAPEESDFPVLLDHPAPRLRAYRCETVVAEKLHAMVDLGMANSRMRDFDDMRFLAATFEFDGADIARAIESTRFAIFPAVTEPLAMAPRMLWCNVALAAESVGILGEKGRGLGASPVVRARGRAIAEPHKIRRACGQTTTMIVDINYASG